MSEEKTDTGWNEQRIAAVARLACTLIASVAAGCGLAVDADALYTGAACALALAGFAWSWWANNNVTKAAQEAQAYLDTIKAKPKE